MSSQIIAAIYNYMATIDLLALEEMTPPNCRVVKTEHRLLQKDSFLWQRVHIQ